MNGREDKKSMPDPDEFITGIRKNDKTLLSKAITLVESNLERHYSIGRKILNGLKNDPVDSIRIAVSGPPGAGKSTLIEKLGLKFIDDGFKVAVLAVDPSSSITKGSILGDKTRMEELAKNKNCFIRPSPSGGTLGGVTRKSRETIMLLESAGYDVIIVETVGVGQSETAVRWMTDIFVLVVYPGGGDELQGIKRGIMEISDIIVINKIDAYSGKTAERTKAEFNNALQFIPVFTEGLKRRVQGLSAITGEGIEDLRNNIMEFADFIRSEGLLGNFRKKQSVKWMMDLIENILKDRFFGDESVSMNMELIKKKVESGELLPTEAAEELTGTFFKSPDVRVDTDESI